MNGFMRTKSVSILMGSWFTQTSQQGNTFMKSEWGLNCVKSAIGWVSKK